MAMTPIDGADGRTTLVYGAGQSTTLPRTSLDKYRVTHVSDTLLDIADGIDAWHERQRRFGRAACRDCGVPLY